MEYPVIKISIFCIAIVFGTQINLVFANDENTNKTTITDLKSIKPKYNPLEELIFNQAIPRSTDNDEIRVKRDTNIQNIPNLNKSNATSTGEIIENVLKANPNLLTDLLYEENTHQKNLSGNELSRVKRQYYYDNYYGRRRYPVLLPILVGGGYGFGGSARGFGGIGFGGRGFGARGFGGRGFGGRGIGGRGIGGLGGRGIGGIGGGRGGRG